jgi:hypothetical protein
MIATGFWFLDTKRYGLRGEQVSPTRQCRLAGIKVPAPIGQLKADVTLPSHHRGAPVLLSAFRIQVRATPV